MTIVQTNNLNNNSNKDYKAASSRSPVNITNNANIRVISSGTGHNRSFAVIAANPSSRPLPKTSPVLKKKVTPLWAKPKQGLPSPKEVTGGSASSMRPKPNNRAKLQPVNQGSSRSSSGMRSPTATTTFTSSKGAALKRRRGVRKHGSGGSGSSHPSYDEPADNNRNDSMPASPEEDRQFFCTTPSEDYFSTEPEPIAINTNTTRPVLKKGPSTGRGTLYRYPSVFEDYFDEPASAMDSPIHTIEDLVDRKEKQVWGKYWSEEMHKASTARPLPPQRATTIEVKELIRHRRKAAGGTVMRMDTMASWIEEEEL
jgi:hypothetical protein